MKSHQESSGILEWAACPSSSGSSWLRNQTGVSWIAGVFFTSWATREAYSIYKHINNIVEEDSWESIGLQGDPTSPFWGRSVLNIHREDWYWSWSSNTLAIWCEELTHLKRPWCWERLRAGEEGVNRGWDGWMASPASPTQWTWVWVNSGSWWWTGRSGVLRFMGWQRVGHDWAT